MLTSKAIFLIALTQFAIAVMADTTGNEQAGLYSQTYGNTTSNNYLVFLHGGPGYNSASFEFSVAPRLGEKVFTIAYDRSSTSRSAKGDANHFTFDHAIRDIDKLLKHHGFDPEKHPLTLMGHSFGGTVALRYMSEKKNTVNRVILVNTPISYQRSLANILDRCKAAYGHKKDRTNLNYLSQIEKMDKESQEYVGFLQVHSLMCGLHNPPVLTAENQALITRASKSRLFGWMNNSQQQPFFGFYRKERYSLLDDKTYIAGHSDKISYIHGKQDFSLDENDRKYLMDLLGANFFPIEGAGHNVFFDQESSFIDSVLMILDV